MEDKIKFYEIDLDLEYDGDETDLRLHGREKLNWGAETPAEYEEATNAIDAISYKGNGWEVYAIYDVSGFDYWMLQQEQPNYITMTIMFDNDTVDVTEIPAIKNAMDMAYSDAYSISEKYDYVPNSEYKGNMSDEEVEKEYDKILSIQILSGDIDEDEVEELSVSEKRKFLKNFYNDKYAKGGYIKSHYNTGRSWHLDRQKHNKSESWEKPMNKRKYDEGGGVYDYKITLKSWDADVYEDDYNEGEGKQVNSFGERVNKSFSTAEDFFKYINNSVLYTDMDKEYYDIMDDGRIVTSLLVDVDNSPASKSEIEEWKNGNLKLYSASYDFYVTLTKEKEPTADELSELLGIGVYKQGGSVDGRSTRAKNTWNSGASWTRDRNAYNKNEDWEKPLNKRGKSVSKSVASRKSASSKGKSKNYMYIPNYMISGAEVSNKGKTTDIDGANILDGIYVKKGTKYAKGGGVEDNRMNERTRAAILKIQKTGIHPDDVSPNFVNEIANEYGIKLTSEEVVYISDNYNKTSDKYAKGGGVGNGYMVFNYTDNLYASNDIFATKKEANNFISQFRKRFEQQGYYRDSNMNKIDIDDIDLLVIDENFNPFRYAEGGGVPDLDKKMALINLDMIHEYSVKLDNMVTEETELEEWVKMKLTRIEQNIADVKHALEGGEKFDKGGMIFKKQLLHISKYAKDLIDMVQAGSNLMAWQENKLAIAADNIDGIYHYMDYLENKKNSDDYLPFAKGGGVSSALKNWEDSMKSRKDIEFLRIEKTQVLPNGRLIIYYKYNTLNVYDSTKVGTDIINQYAKGGRVPRNVGRDSLFKSKQDWEQKYDRKREWKEYKKENWFANWFKDGGGVGTIDLVEKDGNYFVAGTKDLKTIVDSLKEIDFELDGSTYDIIDVKENGLKAINTANRNEIFIRWENINDRKFPNEEGIMFGYNNWNNYFYFKLTNEERAEHPYNNWMHDKADMEDRLRYVEDSMMKNGGNVGRDLLFKSKQKWEQDYDRKREWKEYKKEGWFANWFKDGGGVGDFKGVYSSDEMFTLNVYNLKNELLSSKNFRAKNQKEANQIAEYDYEEQMQKKFGKDLRFEVKLAPNNYAKGGRVKNYKYVPNHMIESVDVERNGKTTEIDGGNILDGLYVKNTKFEEGGEATYKGNDVYPPFVNDNFDYGSDLTDEGMVKNNLVDGEISSIILKQIVGCELSYPYQIVGAIKLEKCFMRPYYRIA